MNDFTDLTDFDTAEPGEFDSPVPVATVNLSRREKAAVILGIMGAESAKPMLEQLDQSCQRSFASAMAQLDRIDPATAAAIINEFIAELETSDLTMTGGLDRAREMLQPCVEDKVLRDILDEADVPNAKNVWEKLVKVDDAALIELLQSEHPQTAAVIVDRLEADKAATLLDRLPADDACRVILGLNHASQLPPQVVDAIGQSVSRDFLAIHRPGFRRSTPADKIGAIMNFAAGEMRHEVLAFLGRVDPELLADVRRKMFTFEDIATRVERRDITTIVRSTPNEVLLPALAGAAENAPQTREFFLANISSRVAEQLREELDDIGQVKLRIAEEAQTEIIKLVRRLQGDGVIKLKELDD